MSRRIFKNQFYLCNSTLLKSLSLFFLQKVNLRFFEVLHFCSGDWFFPWKPFFIQKSLNSFLAMLVIADGFRRLILLFLPWFHFLISGKLTGIDLVQIWIALVPKGTGSVPQSMGKRNWSRSKRNWEIPISDQNRSAFILDCLKYFHHLILHLLKSKTKLHNQHNINNSKFSINF